MKGIKKSIIHTAIFFGVIVGVVLATRIANGFRYQHLDISEAAAYYSDPGDISLYPQDIESLDIHYINNGAAQGFHMIPSQIEKPGIIVVYGGSDGTPGYDQAVRFAQGGYEVLSLFMYGQSNQEKTLSRIPLEQFEDALSYIKENARDSSMITLYGASKGAEYSLLLATKYEEIDHLILVSPSAYIFNGLDFQDYGSSWTWEGSEIAHVDVKKSSFAMYLTKMMLPILIGSPISYGPIYDSAVSYDDQIERKAIPVSDTEADILLIAGDDDKMWNSKEMAEMIYQERPENTTLKIYEGAGHIFGVSGVIKNGSSLIRVGGTEVKNKEAYDQSQALIMEQLACWHVME